MKNKLLKSSIFVLCAGIVFYIISLSFFSAFNKNYITGLLIYACGLVHYSVPVSVIQNQYFPGFISFTIALVLGVIGGILLFIGYLIERVDRRKVLKASNIVIFFGIVFSFITLAIFLIFNGYVPGSLDTSVIPHVYRLTSESIQGYYFKGYGILPISLGSSIIGIILLLLALFLKERPGRNEIKEENPSS